MASQPNYSVGHPSTATAFAGQSTQLLHSYGLQTPAQGECMCCSLTMEDYIPISLNCDSGVLFTGSSHIPIHPMKPTPLGGAHILSPPSVSLPGSLPAPFTQFNQPLHSSAFQTPPPSGRFIQYVIGMQMRGDPLELSLDFCKT